MNTLGTTVVVESGVPCSIVPVSFTPPVSCRNLQRRRCVVYFQAKAYGRRTMFLNGTGAIWGTALSDFLALGPGIGTYLWMMVHSLSFNFSLLCNTNLSTILCLPNYGILTSW